MNPLVSVHIVTYNQKDYIGKAIESALSQKTNFNFEIIIGDDHSTDGTIDILNKYKDKFPDKIILNILSQKGKGMIGRVNFESTLKLCKGKYIAFLDGDDYWMDNGKLQKQVDFLEKENEFILCHHDCEAEDTGGVRLKKEFNRSMNISGFYEACQITIPFMSSVVMRRSGIDFYNRNELFKDLDYGDFGLWIMASLKGKFYYMDMLMAHYRVNKESLSSTLGYEVHVINRIRFAESLLSGNYSFDRKFLKRLLCKYYNIYSGYCIARRNINEGIKYLNKSIVKYFNSITVGEKGYKWIDRLKWRRLIYLYAANIYQAMKTS